MVWIKLDNICMQAYLTLFQPCGWSNKMYPPKILAFHKSWRTIMATSSLQHYQHLNNAFSFLLSFWKLSRTLFFSAELVLVLYKISSKGNLWRIFLVAFDSPSYYASLPWCTLPNLKAFSNFIYSVWINSLFSLLLSFFPLPPLPLCVLNTIKMVQGANKRNSDKWASIGIWIGLWQTWGGEHQENTASSRRVQKTTISSYNSPACR